MYVWRQKRLRCQKPRLKASTLHVRRYDHHELEDRAAISVASYRAARLYGGKIL